MNNIATITNATISTAEHKTILLSKKGMKELRKSIAQLEHDRQVITRSLHELDKTTGHDDRLERIERLARLESVESELIDKKHSLNIAKLIPTKRARLQVAIGSVVDLIDQQGKLIRYTIVDTIEANPSDGRISVLSPLGKSLVGKTVKDIVQWGNGLQQNTFQLVRIG
jgi:transcription elongation factor GreA